MLSRSSIALWCLAGIAAGCATWQKPETNLRLPVPKLPVDAVVCQVAFVQWDSGRVDQDEAFWRVMDEQCLPPDVRRRLGDNGLRAGLISGQLPATIQQKLAASSDPVAALTAERLPAGAEMLSRRERRQCRLGISEIIEVLPHRPHQAVVLSSDDEGHVRCDRFDRPRGFFMLTPYAQPDGRLRLELVPGVEHGDPKQRYMGHSGGMRLDVRRDQQLYHALTFAVPMTEDQTLIVTSSPDPRGIGATFFANRFESSTERLLLLIRMARAQRDDLFLPSEQPLVTPFD
jgi:hypothetical protein